MAKYVIGDIHGCGDEFELLLQQLAYNPSVDQVYLAGDLCGRGPKPLKVLNLAMKYDLPMVFGNWDIHLLSCMFGVREGSVKDNFSSIFEQDEKSFKLCRDWLLTHQFVINDPNFLLVHASVLPTWTEDQILTYDQQAKAYLLQLTQDLPKFKTYFGGKFIQALSQDITCNPDLRRCIEAIMIFTINRVQQLQLPNTPAQLFSGNSAQTELSKLQNYLQQVNNSTSSQVNNQVSNTNTNSDLYHNLIANYSTIVSDYNQSFFDFELKEKGKPVYDFAQGKFSWYMWEQFLQELSQKQPELLAHNPNLAGHSLNKPIYFGHWSMLNGEELTPGYICTDTSCVYGDSLSAYLLPEKAIDMHDHKALLALAKPCLQVKNLQGSSY